VIGQVSVTALEDEWQRRATAAAIEAARGVVKDGALPSGTPIGRLADHEWGWIVAAVLFGWIKTRAEQATGEGLDTETMVRMTGYDPDPWDAGAVATILPELAAIEGIDWSKPLNDCSHEEMVSFLMKALALIRKATIARDLGGGAITKRNPHAIAREANAAAGNSLMAPDDLDDQIPW